MDSFSMFKGIFIVKLVTNLNFYSIIKVKLNQPQIFNAKMDVKVLMTFSHAILFIFTLYLNIYFDLNYVE